MLFSITIIDGIFWDSINFRHSQLRRKNNSYQTSCAHCATISVQYAGCIFLLVHCYCIPEANKVYGMKYTHGFFVLVLSYYQDFVDSCDAHNVRPSCFQRVISYTVYMTYSYLYSTSSLLLCAALNINWHVIVEKTEMYFPKCFLDVVNILLNTQYNRVSPDTYEVGWMIHWRCVMCGQAFLSSNIIWQTDTQKS